MTSLLAVWLFLSPNLGEEALRYASLLASTIGPRPAGTAPAKRAADEIAASFEACGYAPQRHNFTTIGRDGVEVMGQSFLPPMEAHLDGQNVWARLGPPGKPALLLGAHYDSVSMQGPGARDNAAGVGVMLAVACELQKNWRGEHPIIFVAFDGEEINLLGSAAFVRDMPAGEVAFVLSLDVLGDDHLSLNGLSRLVGASLLSAALRAANESDVALEVPMAQLVISRLLPEIERSDHGPFTAAKIPAFQLYSRGMYGFDTHYHATTDTVERLSATELGNAARWIVAFLPMVDAALSQNVTGESLPVGSLVVPAWGLGLWLVLSVLLAVFAVVAARRMPPAWSEVLRSYLGWTVVSLVGAAAFFVPFVAGQLWTGFNTPWLGVIEWYIVAGVLWVVFSVEGFRPKLAGSRRFLFFSLVLLLVWELLLWWIGSWSAASVVALAVVFVSLGILFEGRGRWLGLVGPIVGMGLLSPWRYVEGTLTGTLAAGGWLYFGILWVVLWSFGGALIGVLPSTKKSGWIAMSSGVLAVLCTVVAMTRPAYTGEFPRRAEVVLRYGGDTYGEVVAWRGESLQGLTLRTRQGETTLTKARERFSILSREVAAVETSVDGDGVTVKVRPLLGAFAQVRIDYRASRDGRAVPFRYRVKGNGWQEVLSPLGLRVGFYGVEALDTRDIELPEGATLEARVSVTLSEVPEKVSLEGGATVWGVEAVFEQRVQLR